jgi:hypothetical protein
METFHTNLSLISLGGTDCIIEIVKNARLIVNFSAPGNESVFDPDYVKSVENVWESHKKGHAIKLDRAKNCLQYVIYYSRYLKEHIRLTYPDFAESTQSYISALLSRNKAVEYNESLKKKKNDRLLYLKNEIESKSSAVSEKTLKLNRLQRRLAGPKCGHRRMDGTRGGFLCWADDYNTTVPNNKMIPFW